MSSLDEPGGAAEREGSALRTAIFRAAGFFGFWLVLTRGEPADLAAGAVAAVAATWTSLRLMPAGTMAPTPDHDRQLPIALPASIDHGRNRRRMAGA